MGGNLLNKNLTTFVNQMIADKGADFDAESLEDEKNRLVDLLNEKLDAAMVNALPEDKLSALEKLIDEKGDDATENEITAIIYSSQGLINDAVEKAMAEFREAYLRGEI